MDLDYRFELIKIDLLILAAIFSAYQLDFETHDAYFGLGIAVILFVTLFQFASIIPRYEGEGRYRLEKLKPPTLDFIIGCHMLGVLYIVNSFSNYPNMQSTELQAFNIGAGSGFIFLLIGLGRYNEVRKDERELAGYMMVSLAVMEFLLLAFLGGVYTYTVGL